ncbi:MAG: outer membrane protein assembly factor BamE [Steroidobacteraceae bacterium]
MLLLAASSMLLSTGCIYRMTIQQGNFLDPEQVQSLEVGMTRSQVNFLLGTPMVPPAFDNDRWDYYYYLKGRPLKSPVTRKLIVFFENDKVSKIDRTQMPDSYAPIATNPG